MLSSKCFYQIVYDIKKSKFIKEQDASELLSSLSIKTPLIKIPLVGSLLYQEVNARCKMNEIIIFLLAGDKCMPEIHLRQRGFSCSACGQFTKKNTKI